MRSWLSDAAMVAAAEKVGEVLANIRELECKYI